MQQPVEKHTPMMQQYFSAMKISGNCLDLHCDLHRESGTQESSTGVLRVRCSSTVAAIRSTPSGESNRGTASALLVATFRKLGQKANCGHDKGQNQQEQKRAVQFREPLDPETPIENLRYLALDSSEAGDGYQRRR